MSAAAGEGASPASPTSAPQLLMLVVKDGAGGTEIGYKVKSDHTLEVIAKHFCQQTGRPVGSITLHRLGQEGADGAELPLSAQFGELGLAAQDVLIARAKEGAAGAAAPASGASGGPSPAKRARVETAAAAGAGGSPTPELRQGGAAPAAAAAAAAPVGSGIEKLASEHARLLAAKTSLAQELRQLEESRSALRARAQAAAAARCDAAEELGKARKELREEIAAEAAAEAEHEEQEAAVEEAKEELQRVEAELEGVEGRLREQKAANSGAREGVEELEGQVEARAEEVAALRGRLEAVRGHLAGLLAELARLSGGAPAESAAVAAQQEPGALAGAQAVAAAT